MIRPEAAATLARFRDALIGGAVLALGLYWALFTGGGLLHWLGWGVADQGVSSLGNFAFSILLAKALSPTDFGGFTIAWVTYGMILNASRGIRELAGVAVRKPAPVGDADRGPRRRLLPVRRGEDGDRIAVAVG